MALAPGTRLGHYDVTSLLGAGGRGRRIGGAHPPAEDALCVYV